MNSKNVHVGTSVFTEEGDKLVVTGFKNGKPVVGYEKISPEDVAEMPSFEDGDGTFQNPKIDTILKQEVYAVVSEKGPIDPWDIHKHTSYEREDVQRAIRFLRSEHIHRTLDGKLDVS